LVTEGVRRQRLGLRSDDLNSVGEPYTENYFRQLVMAIAATPAFRGGLGELAKFLRRLGHAGKGRLQSKNCSNL
jgi:hypothetical protein